MTGSIVLVDGDGPRLARGVHGTVAPDRTSASARARAAALSRCASCKQRDDRFARQPGAIDEDDQRPIRKPGAARRCPPTARATRRASPHRSAPSRAAALRAPARGAGNRRSPAARGASGRRRAARRARAHSSSSRKSTRTRSATAPDVARDASAPRSRRARRRDSRSINVRPVHASEERAAGRARRALARSRRGGRSQIERDALRAMRYRSKRSMPRVGANALAARERALKQGGNRPRRAGRRSQEVLSTIAADVAISHCRRVARPGARRDPRRHARRTRHRFRSHHRGSAAPAGRLRPRPADGDRVRSRRVHRPACGAAGRSAARSRC